MTELKSTMWEYTICLPYPVLDKGGLNDEEIFYHAYGYMKHPAIAIGLMQFVEMTGKEKAVTLLRKLFNGFLTIEPVLSERVASRILHIIKRCNTFSEYGGSVTESEDEM